LVGVLIGAGATYTATSAADRARWRRAQSVRWDEKRASTYAEYGFAIKKVIGLAVRMAAHRWAHSLGEPLPPDEGVSLLADAEQERQLKWETVLLLGSDEVVMAGRRWHESVFPLEDTARGYQSADDWDRAVEEASRARGEFYEAARHDLGLPSTGSPRAYDWQFNRVASASLEARIPPITEP
jgi:hypothetical protein